MKFVFFDKYTVTAVNMILLNIGNKDIRGCVACNSCKKNGKCVFDDAVNEAAEKLKEADGLVVGTPVYVGSANGSRS